MTGGSSAINGQIFLRGIPEDYDDWAEWGNDEWGFQKLTPYFNKEGPVRWKSPSCRTPIQYPWWRRDGR